MVRLDRNNIVITTFCTYLFAKPLAWGRVPLLLGESSCSGLASLQHGVRGGENKKDEAEDKGPGSAFVVAGCCVWRNERGGNGGGKRDNKRDAVLWTFFYIFFSVRDEDLLSLHVRVYS